MLFRLQKKIYDSITAYKTKKADKSVHITQNPEIASNESTVVSETKLKIIILQEFAQNSRNDNG